MTIPLKKDQPVTTSHDLTEYIIQLLRIIEENTPGMSYVDRMSLKSKVLKCYQTYTISVTKELPVLNPKKLPLELSEELKYQLGSLLGEALTEQCASFKVTKNKITTTVIALKLKE